MVRDTIRTAGSASRSTTACGSSGPWRWASWEPTTRVCVVVSGVDGQQRVQAVLGVQDVADPAVVGQHPDPADAPVVVSGVEEVVDVDGPVGSVEGSDPEVREAVLSRVQ